MLTAMAALIGAPAGTLRVSGPMPLLRRGAGVSPAARQMACLSAAEMLRMQVAEIALAALALACRMARFLAASGLQSERIDFRRALKLTAAAEASTHMVRGL